MDEVRHRRWRGKLGRGEPGVASAEPNARFVSQHIGHILRAVETGNPSGIGPQP